MGGWSSDSGSARDYDWSSSSRVTKKSAREYASEDKRAYSKQEDKGINAPVNKDIKTDSEMALILVVDVTGSMREWPKTIFQKIPTLYAEANASIQGYDPKELEKDKTKAKTLEDKLEMAVIAIGDTHHDQYPLQVVDFSKGGELVKGINKIFPEGGGGPFGKESYGLAAYYLDKHCKTPNASKGQKPILVFACDEDFYDSVSIHDAKKYTGDTISNAQNSDNIIKHLAKDFDLYILRPEPQGSNGVYEGAEKHWKEVVMPEKVMKMNSPNRLVDCIIGICGYASGNFEKAKGMLERRQTPEQVKEVLATLHPLLSKKDNATKAEK